MLGFNKFTDDVSKLGNRFAKCNVYANLDYSRFDVTLSPGLINEAFMALKYFFGLQDKSEDSRVLDWL